MKIIELSLLNMAVITLAMSIFCGKGRKQVKFRDAAVCFFVFNGVVMWFSFACYIWGIEL